MAFESTPSRLSSARPALPPAVTRQAALDAGEASLPEPIAPPARDAVFRRSLAVADLAAAAIGLVMIRWLQGVAIDLVGLLALPLVVVIAKITGRYDYDELLLRKSTLDEVPRLFSLAAWFALTWSAVVYVTEDSPHLHGIAVTILWLSTGIALIAARSGARFVGQLVAPPERVLIAGDAASRHRLARALLCDPGARIDVVGFLPLEDERQQHADWGERSRRRRTLSIDDMGTVVRELRAERVFLISQSADSETMLECISRTTALGVKVSIVPRLFEVVGSAVEFDTVGGVTVLGVRRAGLTRSSRAIKRLVDVVVSAIGLAFLAPLFAAIAVAIKLDSPGLVFFRQRRVGKAGRVFYMIKFRSMVDGAEAQHAALQELNESEGVFKLRRDPRVTRVGRWLRRSSIDELPQLFNVLRGDMSLVGPRPLVLDEDSLIEGRHRRRLHLAPGMTGPWQVLGPTRPPLSEMVKADYLYATNWSLWADIKIIVRTVGHMFSLRGA